MSQSETLLKSYLQDHLELTFSAVLHLKGMLFNSSGILGLCFGFLIIPLSSLYSMDKVQQKYLPTIVLNKNRTVNSAGFQQHVLTRFSFPSPTRSHRAAKKTLVFCLVARILSWMFIPAWSVQVVILTFSIPAQPSSLSLSQAELATMACVRNSQSKALELGLVAPVSCGSTGWQKVE